MNKAMVLFFVVGLMVSVAQAGILWWQSELQKEHPLMLSINPLLVPDDCDSYTMRNFATKCGLQEHYKGDHFIVTKFIVSNAKSDVSVVSTIPEHVEDFDTCERIVQELNERCTIDY